MQEGANPGRLAEHSAKHKSPGRKYAVEPASILKRAYDLQLTFEERRGPIDWDALVKEHKLGKAFRKMESLERQRHCHPYYQLILITLDDPGFPKRDRVSQIRFLAESISGPSLAGKDNHGKYRMSIRRSRDICVKLHAHPPFQIIRQEFYVECTCGYQGPALDGACRQCRTRSSNFPWDAE